MPPDAEESDVPGGRDRGALDTEILRWIKSELRQAEQAGQPVPSTAGLLRAWRAEGGRVDARLFSELVDDARS